MTRHRIDLGASVVQSLLLKLVGVRLSALLVLRYLGLQVRGRLLLLAFLVETALIVGHCLQAGMQHVQVRVLLQLSVPLLRVLQLL